MSVGDLPMMAASSYASSTTALPSMAQNFVASGEAKAIHRNALVFHHDIHQPEKGNQKMPAAVPTRRLVQVFIADINPNVPLNDCLIYRGDQHLTDLDDNELFFELDIKTLLAAHNEKRVKLLNKAVKDREEHLEPARVRDLKMTVVTIASF